MNKPQLFGKYPGVVTQSQESGKVKVKVPLLFGEQELPAWALPCWPPAVSSYTPKSSGIAVPVSATQYQAPQAGAGVWVEFLAGDPDYPIWTGLSEVVN